MDSERSDNPGYFMLIEWSREDQAYIVSVPELPGCVSHGATYEEAVSEGKDAIESWVDIARELGRPIPQPEISAGSQN